MPHLRARHLEPLLKKSLSYSPLVGVLGHRQVGKTTLTSQLGSTYATLDLTDSLALAQTSPQSFLAQNRGKPGVIDECQLSPALFPAMKEWVRLHPEPGQFLLTGSVRFASRKAIRESLTGRIISWELLPMDWAEQNGQPLPDQLPRLLKSRDVQVPLARNPKFNLKSYEKHLENGGLPGVFSVRDSAIRSQRFETQIATLLERDLRLLVETTLPYRTLRALLEALALQVGTPLNVASLARATRLSLITIRKLLQAFESLFLIRLIPCHGDYKKPVLFFEDLGELRHLLKTKPSRDSDLLFFIYQNCRTQFHYRPELQGLISSFRTRGGNDVPLVFQAGNSRLGIIPCADENQIGDAVSRSRRFLASHANARVLIVGLDSIDQMIDPRTRWVGVDRVI